MAGSKGKGSRASYQKRQKYALAELLDRSKDLPDNYDDLVSAYRTLAKAADQRLVRLEKLALEPNYGNATQWAYARAQRDIKEWSGEGATRFNTKPPAREGELRRKIEDIRTFMLSPTSTKKGIKESLKKRADTLNKKFGTDFKWDDIGKYFEGNLAKKLEQIYGSKTIMRMIAAMQKKKKAIIDAIDKSKKEDIRTPDSNKMVEKMMNKVIKKYGKEVKEFLQPAKK